MAYTPFPIVDYRTGLFTAKEAWISPPDAFTELKNANIFRGRVRKRRGVDYFGVFPTRLDDADGAALTLTWGNSGSLIEVTISAVHGLSTGAYIFVDGTSGGTHQAQVEDKFFFVTVTSTTAFTLDHSSQAGVSITAGQIYVIRSITKAGDVSAVTNADPAQITTLSAHGLSTGNKVILLDEENNAFAGLTSLVEAVTTVTVNSTTTLLLDDIDSSDMGTYTSGGAVGLISTSTDQIVGLGELFQNEADNKLIVCSPNRAAEYNSTSDAFVPLPRVKAMSSGSLANTTGLDDPFTGTGTDLFQLTNAFGKLWFTNFKDNVFSYDGTDFVRETFNIDGDGGSSLTFGTHNDLTRCRFIFQYNRRLVLLSTVETTDGTKPQRARWSRIDYGVGTSSEWDDTAADTTAGSLDADTDEEIIAATFLKDTLIVFFERSIWALRKTGSFDPPFRWEKLSEHPGVFASRFGAISHDQFAWAFGSGGLIATDGIQTRRADDVIPDFEDEVDDNNYKRVYLSKSIAQRETWLSYSTESNTSNDQVKVLDYENGAYSEYLIPYNVMSEYTTQDASGTTWAQLNVVPDDYWQNKFLKWLEFGATLGAPENVIGDDGGIVYIVNAGASDQGRKIELLLETARFNPFKEQGKTAALGYIDFLFNQNPASQVKIEFFADFDEAPYSTQTIALASEDSVDTIDKVWKRVYVDTIANEHRLKISHNEAGQPVELHAMIPHFRPAGRVLFR